MPAASCRRSSAPTPTSWASACSRPRTCWPATASRSEAALAQVTLHLACGPGEIRALLAYDEVPAEILIERHPDFDLAGSLTGRVFHGRVRRLLPAAGGAFVDLGTGADGFLDEAAGLTEGAAVTVQVTRPPTADKPPGLSRRLQLAGAFLVLTPAAAVPGVELSRRLDTATRARLRALLTSSLAAGEGLTVRTAAADASPGMLQTDLRQLQARAARLARRPETVPAAAEPERSWPLAALERLLPLLARERPSAVLVDDRPTLTLLQRLVQERLGNGTPPTLAPAQGPVLEAAIQAALDPVVPLPGGGRLVIERTLACTMVDVDGGPDRALPANLAAARALAPQLRLRRIGGPVVVDFISMEGLTAREQVQAALADAAAVDPARPQILGWTRLGHLELIRPRVAVPLADRFPVPAPRSPARRADDQDPAAVATALKGLAAYAPTPPGTVLALPAAAVALLTRCGRAVLEALAASRGEPVRLEADPTLSPDAFTLTPLSRRRVDPISNP